MKWLQSSPDGVILNLRIVPRASKNEISGEMQDALKIRLQAPPVEGKANKALVKFLSDKLDVAPSRITILAGDLSRNKRVYVSGLTAAQVTERL